jgi:hypothetical protein
MINTSVDADQGRADIEPETARVTTVVIMRASTRLGLLPL